MIPQWVIEKKRDGQPLTEEELRAFVTGYTHGEIPDYQMAALAMAIYFRGMSLEETITLTDVMMRSGAILDTSGIPHPKIDKHSTGGIGDKVSLALAPLVACCGVAVPMISGRGLGITGGTLDKLEAIPGYRTLLSADAFLRIVRTCGCSIIGQTAELAPADRKLYALRDVTGTVPSIPLIASSILSKKLAEGLDGLVLDVKWGRGAFMKTRPMARRLARTLVAIASRMGRRVSALITDMNQPLGRTAGHALEVAEAVDILRGRGPQDVTRLVLELAWHMLRIAGKAADRPTALRLLRAQLRSGAALDRFREMVRLHGGVDIVADPAQLPSARLREDYPAPCNGYVTLADAEILGRACLVLGAGRTRTTDSVDPAVGLSNLAKVDQRVVQGQPLVTLHANDPSRLIEAKALLESAFVVSETPARAPRLITDMVEPDHVEPSLSPTACSL